VLARTPERLGDLHPIRLLDLGGARTVRYLDTGESGWHPVVFFGGLGTSAGAFSLTDCYARDERGRLRLRFISVERNGFGGTPFTPGLGFEEAVDDALAALDALEIDRFSVVAISGGGPYAARLIAQVPARLVSVHLAAATSGGELLARGAAARLLVDPAAIAADPVRFWEYPPDSAVHRIPGFVEACREEGRRALGARERAAAALAHEFALLGSQELPGLRDVAAPAFLYWGGRDELVGLDQARAWEAALGTNVTTRVYPEAGHDVQYLHWREILSDIAGVLVT
jgi:pimeloyl-ACP methyl ester carboxylesterase